MKRFIAVILLIATLFALAACGKTVDDVDEGPVSRPAEDTSEVPKIVSTPEPTMQVEKEIDITAPSAEDIRKFNYNSEDFLYPEENEYLSSYVTMYVKSSAEIFTNAKTNVSLGKVTKYQKVDLIAIKKNLGLVTGEFEGEPNVGWMKLELLTYNDPEKESRVTEVDDHSGMVPTLTTIHNRGLEKSLTLPKEDEYAACFDRMYVTSAAKVYERIGDEGYTTFFELKKGSQVEAIAYRDKYALVLALTDMGEKVGWMDRQLLRYDVPEAKLSIVKAKDIKGKPSVKDIEKLGLQNSIKLPEENEYISSYDKMYTVPSTIQLFSHYDQGKSFIEAQLVKGSEVNILAIRNQYALVLFETGLGEKVGWIKLSDLNYNNPTSEYVSSSFVDQKKGTPSVKDIERLGLDKSMTLPEPDMYIDCYDSMFIVPTQVNVYSFIKNSSKETSNLICLLVKGSVVNVIAINEKLACVLCMTDQGEKAGWISLDALYYNSPLNKPDVRKAPVYSGKPSMKDIDDLKLNKCITLPDNENFISSYDKMYVVPASLNVYSFKDYKKNISMVVASLPAGSEVDVIGIQLKNALVLYESDMGTKVGWVMLESLSYNNPLNKKAPVKAKQYTGAPSAMDIESLGIDKSMTMPSNDNLYISTYDKMYTTVKQQPVYSFYEPERNIPVVTLERDSEVTVIAIEKKSACVLYESDQGTKAGWIPLTELSYNTSTTRDKVRVSEPRSGKPGSIDIESLGLQKSVTMPKEDSYIDCFDNMYVSVSSMQVLSFQEKDLQIVGATLPQGSEVTVMAIEEGRAFVLYETDVGTRAGWTLLQYLSYNNPKNALAPTYAQAPSGSPGKEVIENLNMTKSMTMPDESSYISVFETKTASANTAINSFNTRKLIVPECTIAKGSQVVVFARQNGVACVLVQTDKGLKAGWVMESTLRDM